jgi:GH18 family chitinase
MVSLGSLILVCYYTNWAQYRSSQGGQGKFFPSNIDPNL